MSNAANVTSHIKTRIDECTKECANYTRWISRLRLPNIILVGLGSLLAFVGGAAVVTELGPAWIGGVLALVGGAMTGLHGWLGCEAHQSECRKVLGQFESIKSRYEHLLVELDEPRRTERFRELESEVAQIQHERKALPWKGFLDFGAKP